MPQLNIGRSDIAEDAEEPSVDCANHVNNGSGDQSCSPLEKRQKVDLVESAMVRFQSRSLREAVSVNFNETLNEFLTERLENIARGEMLRLLPLWIQARIFSFISVEERVRVLETISGRQAAGQRTQANFRHAVLESYKTVKNIKDFGTKWSKLRLLQATGGLENLRNRFPKLEIKLDGSELQGFIYRDIASPQRVSIVHLSASCISVNVEPLRGLVILVQGIESTSIMMIGTLNKAVRLINLVDHSVRNCAPTLEQHRGGAAAFFNGFVYVVGSRRCCERYNLESDSWERISDMNNDRICCQLVVWNDSLYAVGGGRSLGTVERYDPENNTWTVVFNDCINEPLYDATAVVFEDTLYCCYWSKNDGDGQDLKVELKSVDMRTGKNYTNLRDGLPTPEGKRYDCGVYLMEDKLCFLQLRDIDCTGAQWSKFVLDRSQNWQCTDSGIIESMRKTRDNMWVPLLL